MPQPKPEEVRDFFNREYQSFHDHVRERCPEAEGDRAGALIALNSFTREQIETFVSWTMHPKSGFLPQYTEVKPLNSDIGKEFRIAAAVVYGENNPEQFPAIDRMVIIASDIMETYYNQKTQTAERGR